MLSECIEALQVNPEGIYVDVTFGGGGHSLKILEHLKGGRLIAFDQDENQTGQRAAHQLAQRLVRPPLRELVEGSLLAVGRDLGQRGAGQQGARA